MGYAICRVKSSFRDWLVNEFPVTWGLAANAIVYPTKGDAERIRQRLIPIKSAVVDIGTEKLAP